MRSFTAKNRIKSKQFRNYYRPPKIYILLIYEFYGMSTMVGLSYVEIKFNNDGLILYTIQKLLQMA